MNMFLRHYLTKWKSIPREPLYWYLCLPMILCLFYAHWYEVFQDLYLQRWDGAIRWGLLIALGSLILGGRAANGKSIRLNTYAIPSLPVSPFTRTCAEVAFILTFMGIMLVPALGLIPLGQKIPVLRAALNSTLCVIPLMVVFVPRNRIGRQVYYFETFAVIVCLSLATAYHLISTISGAVLVCITLLLIGRSAGLIDSRFTGFDRRMTSNCRLTCRSALPPEKRFIADMLHLPFSAYGHFWAGLALLQILVSGLERFGLLPEYLFVCLTGCITYAVWALLMCPAGMSKTISETGEQVGFISEFSGAVVKTWTALPLSRIQVVRGIFIHVFVGGALTIGFVYAAQVLAGVTTSFLSWLPYWISLPCLAGFMAAATSGDKNRAIALGVLFCTGLFCGYVTVQDLGAPYILIWLIAFAAIGITLSVPLLTRSHQAKVLS
jgi:hypothetical protein